MFCEKCGKDIGDNEVCIVCDTKDEGDQEKSEITCSTTDKVQVNKQIATKVSINKKQLVIIAIAIAFIGIVGVIVKTVDGGRNGFKKDLLGYELQVGDNTYQINKNNIEFIKDIKKKKQKLASGLLETQTANIQIETEDFIGKGSAEIVKQKGDKYVQLYLEYFPIKGVEEEQVKQDIEEGEFMINEEAYVNSYDYELEVQSINVEKEDFEKSSMTYKAMVKYQTEVFILTVPINLNYRFINGNWRLDASEIGKFEIIYGEGKDLNVTIDDILNEYNRGRLSISFAGSTNIMPLLNKETLTISSTESVGLYNKKIVMNLNHKTPFYTLGGTIDAIYYLDSSGWHIDHLEANPNYIFDLVGNYSGWYEISSWFGDAKKYTGKLLINKLESNTGYYEGEFSFEDSNGEEEKIIKGKYYVTGYYVPENVDQGAKFNMKAEKWITKPENYSMTNLNGIVDYENKCFKGDILAYSDTFELKKDEQ